MHVMCRACIGIPGTASRTGEEVTKAGKAQRKNKQEKWCISELSYKRVTWLSQEQKHRDGEAKQNQQTSTSEVFPQVGDRELEMCCQKTARRGLCLESRSKIINIHLFQHLLIDQCIKNYRNVSTRINGVNQIFVCQFFVQVILIPLHWIAEAFVNVQFLGTTTTRLHDNPMAPTETRFFNFKLF